MRKNLDSVLERSGWVSAHPEKDQSVAHESQIKISLTAYRLPMARTNDSVELGQGRELVLLHHILTTGVLESYMSMMNGHGEHNVHYNTAK